MEYLTDEDYATAAKNGISRKRAYQRFYQNGWDRERAITQPISKISRWDRYKSICEANGILQDTFDDRIRRGWNIDDAANTPLIPNGYSFKKIKGV